MATSGPTNVIAYLENDATFRQYAQAVHDKLIAVGLVQTADTGQLNLATATWPATVNTTAGYEIFRFNDSLQGTLPIFIKVEYGTGGVTNRPSIWLTVGTGSNGTGTINGQAGTRKQVSQGGSKTTGVTLPMYASAGDGWLSFVGSLDAAASTFSCIAHIERSHNSTGDPTAAGIYTAMNSGQGYQYQAIPATGTVPTATTGNPPAINPGAGSVSSAGLEVALSLHIPFFGGIPVVCKNILTYVHADIGELTTFQATVLGDVCTYMPLGDGIAAAFAAQASSPAPTVAIRWE